MANLFVVLALNDTTKKVKWLPFQLWWKKIVLKSENLSKDFAQDCPIFFFFFSFYLFKKALKP